MKQSCEESTSFQEASVIDSSIAHTQMDASTQRSLPQKLHSSFKHFIQMSINIEFFNVNDRLQHILGSYNTKAMLEKCTNIMASEKNNIPLFSSDQLQQFGVYKQAPALIQALTPYFNWSNHSVLREVINSCNNPIALNLIDQFDSQIDLSLPVTDYPIPQPFPNMIPLNTSSNTVLAVKLTAEVQKIPLQRVFDIQHLLQEQFQLSSHVFQLLAVNSTLILYWMIPKSVVSVITANIAQQRGFLHHNGILELSIYPGLIYATSNAVRVGPLSFLNHYVDLEVLYIVLWYECHYVHYICMLYVGKKIRTKCTAFSAK